LIWALVSSCTCSTSTRYLN